MRTKLQTYVNVLLFALSIMGCSDKYVKGTYIASNSEYSLNMSTTDLQSIPAEGGVVNTRIETTNAVNWEIQGLPSWLSTTTLKGNGSQDVSFKAEPNESFTSSRTHIFNIVTSNDDWNVTTPVSATQQKKAKSMSVSPSDNNSLTFDSKGGQVTLAVTSNVSWEAECKETFVHLSQSSAVQDLNIIVTVDAYDQIDVTQNRTATIYFKDSTEEDVLTIVTITQTPLQTSISTENISLEFDQNKNSKVYALGKVSGKYSVSSDASWLTINKNAEEGAVDITVSVDANENDDERTSTAYVYLEASNAVLYRFSVKQKGNSIEVEPNVLSYAADGGVTSVNVTTKSSWKASTQNDWITLQESSSECQIAVAENNSLQARTGTVQFNRINNKGEIVGRTVSVMVSQEARHISPDVQTVQFGPEAATKSISISSDAAWTLSTNDTWITLSAQSGTGNSNVKVSVQNNALTSSRTGTLYLKCLDQTIEILVVQNSAYLNTNSSAINFDAKGGEAKVSISSNVQWSIESQTDWITVTPSNGTENEEIKLYATKNETASQRTGVVTINSLVGTNSINISQSAPSIALSKNSVSFDERGGSEVIVVTCDYDYKITSSDSWIKITNNQNLFTIQTEENANASRTGSVTVQIVGIEGTILRSVNVTQKGDDTPYIDLGLPSKTKWCAYNKGATKIGGTGYLYTGTESDSYRCPSSTQVEELIKKCTWTYVTMDGVTGYSVVGPNGNSIFFPNTTNVSMGGHSMKGMYVWVRGSSSSESQYYLKYSNAYGARTDFVAHKNQSKFSIREVR